MELISTFVFCVRACSLAVAHTIAEKRGSTVPRVMKGMSDDGTVGLQEELRILGMIGVLEVLGVLRILGVSELFELLGSFR